MASIEPTKQGKIPFHLPSIDTPCHTHYLVFGDLSSGVTPLVCLHGGPGASHDYLLPFAQLWPQYGIPVVFYDQIGAGDSTHLDHKGGDESFWVLDLFVAELENLLKHLNLLETGYSLLGQSCGAMLATQFIGSRPDAARGLRRLVLASGIADWNSNRRGLQQLRQALPKDEQDLLNEAERTGDWETPAVKAVRAALGKKHVCRTEPTPDELIASFKKISSAVYDTMYGPIWIAPRGGTLKSWSGLEVYPKITVPTLVYQGEYDTSHELTTRPYFELIPGVRYVTFPKSGHFCHLEDGLREKVFRTVGDFLVAQS